MSELLGIEFHLPLQDDFRVGRQLEASQIAGENLDGLSHDRTDDPIFVLLRGYHRRAHHQVEHVAPTVQGGRHLRTLLEVLVVVDASVLGLAHHVGAHGLLVHDHTAVGPQVRPTGLRVLRNVVAGKP